MRCLALAQAWRDRVGGDVTYVSADPAEWFRRRLGDEGIPVRSLQAEPGGAEDAERSLGAADDTKAGWIVVDGYAFDSDYQTALGTGPAGVLFLDDYAHCIAYSADLVLNQNLHAREEMYAARSDRVRLLLGTRYALLRREFRRTTPPTGTRGSPGARVLVTLGGGDPDAVTDKVVDSVRDVQAGELEVVVVVGPSNPGRDALVRAAESLPFAARVEWGVEDMVPLMRWADLAVCAGGSTCWELAYMGVPSIILILAENQRAIAESLAEAGAADCLGWHADTAPDAITEAIARLASDSGRRRALAERCRRLVDGRGAERVIDAMLETEPRR